MILGLIIGLIVNFSKGSMSDVAYREFLWWTGLLGKDLFIGSLKMIITPLILASIVSGIVSLPQISDLGDIGAKTFVYYFASTAIAVGIGLLCVLLIQPGHRGEV